MTTTSDDKTASAFRGGDLPQRFCNLDRLLHAMAARGLDGIIATQPLDVFYLSGFNGVAHKSDEPRPYAVVLSRHAPEHPILVIADYYLSTLLHQPGWIRDVRPFRAVMMPLDRPPAQNDIDRFITADGAGVDWIEKARAHYRFDMRSAIKDAVTELGLDGVRIGFDDMGYGHRLDLDGVTIGDAYDALMYARSVKTAAELDLLARSTRLNEEAIRRTVAAWQRGASWRDLDRLYGKQVSELGGFLRDPGGMVWGHPRGNDAALVLANGHDDGEIAPGSHVMFDCHGTLDLYCWDGGKTWVVEGEPQGLAKTLAAATAEAAAAVIAAMRPGKRISELQALGRQVYRKAGVPSADDAIIFFHGLGLSHMDIESATPDGKPNGDWLLEAGMVVPLHLLYPGGEAERLWLEEVVVIESDGGRPLFSWGFEPLTG